MCFLVHASRSSLRRSRARSPRSPLPIVCVSVADFTPPLGTGDTRHSTTGPPFPLRLSLCRVLRVSAFPVHPEPATCMNHAIDYDF
eukprot:4645811-Prymnesium_polylepis.1